MSYDAGRPTITTVANATLRKALSSVLVGDYVRQTDNYHIYTYLGSSTWFDMGVYLLKIYTGSTATPYGWTATFVESVGSLYYEGLNVYIDYPENLLTLETTHSGDLDGLFNLYGLSRITSFNASTNKITSAVVDDVLIAINRGNKIGNIINMSGQSPSAPRTADSNSAYSGLTGRGWSITLD